MSTHAAKGMLLQQSGDDPIGVAETCGTVMGSLVRYTEHFSAAFSIACLKHYCIPHRLDFLFDDSRGVFLPRDGHVLKENLQWTCDEDDRIDIRDISPPKETGKMFDGTRLLLFPKDVERPSYYHIRDITRAKSVLDWRFDVVDGQIVVCYPSRGFLDMTRSKTACLFIKWLTNVLGYSRYALGVFVTFVGGLSILNSWPTA